jgi:hypothetical protein
LSGRLYVYYNNAIIAPSFSSIPRWFTGLDQPFYQAANGEIRLKVKDTTSGDASFNQSP